MNHDSSNVKQPGSQARLYSQEDNQNMQKSDVNLEKAQQNEGQESQENSINICQLFRFAQGPDYALMIIGTIASLASGAALPLMGFLWGDMINNFSGMNANAFVDLARQTLLLFIYLGIGQFFASGIMLGCWMLTGERQAIKCRKIYLKSLLKQQISWFDLLNQSELSSKFALDTLAFQGAIGEKISVFLYTVSVCISGIIIAFVKGWLLALSLFALIPLLSISAFLFITSIQGRAKKQKQEYARAGGQAEQAISSIKTIKILNGEEYQTVKYRECLEEVGKSSFSFGMKTGLAMGGTTFIMLLGYSLAFWFGSHCIEGTQRCSPEISGQRYTSGQVFTVFISVVISGFNISQLMPSLKKIGEGMQGAKRIYQVIDRDPKIKNVENPKIINDFKGEIVFQNVTFAYPKEKGRKILKNFSMKTHSNKIALAGESGCGKSTIFQLLMRFYDPDQGRITLDGIDLKELDLAWLRSIIGYVGQEPVLFATSIKRNLLFANEDATEQQIDQALKKAQAYNFVYSLEDKLESFVGYGGTQLSGGQKQRIAIARALLRDPKILLLDEATSALDRKNEKLIQQTLEKVAQNRISLTIAHRVKTIMNSDQIFVLKKGQISQHGKFSQLQQFKGIEVEKNEVDMKKQNKEIDDLQEKQLQPQKEKEQIKLSKEEIEKKQKEQLLETYGQNAFSRTFSYTSGNIPVFLLGILFALIAGAIMPVFSLFLAENLFMLFRVKQNRQKINLYSLAFLLLGLGYLLCVVIFNTIFTVLGEKIVRKIRIEVYEKILKLPIPWFDNPKNSIGSITARLAVDCKQVNEMTTTYIYVLLQNLSTLITGLVIAFAYEWRISLVSLGLLPIMIASSALRIAFKLGSANKIEAAYKQSTNLITESMMNIRTVESFGYDNIISKEYDKMMQTPYSMTKKDSVIGGILYGLGQFMMYLIIGLIFFIASAFMADPNVVNEFEPQELVPKFFTAIFSIFFAGMTVGNNSHFLPDLKNCKVSAANLFAILDSEDENQIQQRQNSKMLKQGIEGDILFDNISFKYQSRTEPLFEDLQMKIKYGDKSAFVGASGCGKSTLIQFLLKFYEPDSGKVIINGNDLKDYDLHYLRNSFGVVSQEPVLFEASFKENIIYNLPDVSEKELRRAADNAHALSFIEGKEEILGKIKEQGQMEKKQEQEKTGFDRGVGIKGSHISGGQKQRVAIARAILRNPSMLLLDEATSALDSVNEKRVQECLDQIMKDRTTITIAHRMETIKNSDVIYVFEKGKIVETGNFQTLKAMKGYFYNLERGTEFV